MDTNGSDPISSCRSKVLQWLLDFQVERKCSYTNSVSRAIEKLNNDEQVEVVKLLSVKIKELISERNCVDTVKGAANVLNGCFDNFPHAQKAVSMIFGDVIHFINECLAKCLSFFLNEDCNLKLDKLSAIELLHVLSRLSTLVLKLRRRKEDFSEFGTESATIFRDLSIASSKIICDLEEIAIDTRINLAMSLWIMKEVYLKDNLASIHDSFTLSLNKDASKEDYNTTLVKFVMASAAISVWDDEIVTPPQTSLYLQFFLTLSESYSSETPVLLMCCRALQILGKHKSFLAHCLDSNEAKRLVGCNLMFMEHTVPCVRHSGRDLLKAIVKVPTIQPAILNEMLSLSPDRKAFSIVIAALATTMDSRKILLKDPSISEKLLSVIKDPNSAPHVAFALESMALHDSLANSDIEQWCDLWVMPLLYTLSQCMTIEKLLQKVFQEYPNAIDVVLEKWKNPDSDQKLRGIITCLKIQNKLIRDGTKFCHLLSSYNADIVLKTCLTHGEDDIRLAAFSLIAEGLLLSQTDLDLVLYFLKYNLNNHKPATRQKVLSLIKKIVVRVNCVYMNLIKPAKNREVTTTPETYVTFMSRLIEFCYGNIFASANYNRLNTVLSILVMCQELMDPAFAEMTVLYDKKFWPKCMVALESSYEENKVMAVAVAKKLPFVDSDSANLCQNFRQAFGRIQELEPPNVLYGSYLLCVLLKHPKAETVLRQYFSSTIVNPSAHAEVLCIQILTNYLKVQIQDVKENLLSAPRLAPMYGTMFVIRLLLKELDKVVLNLFETKEILQELVPCSFGMGDAVSSVVNNSSPEGHLPMDFQQLVDVKKEENDDYPILEEVVPKTGSLEELQKYYKEAATPEEKLSLAGTIRGLLEAELERKLDHGGNFNLLDLNCEAWFRDVRQTKELMVEYDCYYKFFEGHLPRIREERSVTAQALLLCSWRSMKESCLYLGDLTSKVPLKDALEIGLLTEDLILKIGAKLRVLLSSIKHRGAFEQADVGFSSLCYVLWQCPIPHLQNLPYQWLLEVLEEILLDPDDQKTKFTSTRRSAGLPFLIQAIISTEISSNYSPSGRCLQLTMNTLLSIAENDEEGKLETRLHAFNIIRSLFKHAQLGEFVAPYVSRALQISIKGSRDSTWPVRNCSNMLFSTLVIRIFGVSRSKDNLSKKNKMTTKIFFQRFPELYNFFLDEINRVQESKDGVSPQPSLYLVLLVINRLYPPSSEDFEETGLEPFVQFMTNCAGNPIHRIRLLAARAIVPLIPAHSISRELVWRVEAISKRKGISENRRHGLLLQTIGLLNELKCQDIKIPDLSICWWILSVQVNSSCRRPCFPIMHAFIEVLWCLWRSFPGTRPNIKAILSDDWDLPLLTYWASDNSPGVQPFIASLLLLKLDALAEDCRTENSLSSTCTLLQHIVMLKSCGLEVVENIVLQFVYNIVTPESSLDADLDYSLTEGVVESMLSFAGDNRAMMANILSSSWDRYVESEKMLLKDISVHQQRRLRIVILGNILQNSNVDLRDKMEAFEVVCLYAAFWNTTRGSLSFKTPFGFFNYSNIAYEQLCIILDPLIEEDRQCRLAVADMFHKAWWSLKSEQKNLELLKFWLYLFRLLLDEDESVRHSAHRTVRHLTEYCSSEFGMANIDIPYGGLTPLQSQEILLQCLITLRGIPDSFVDLVCLAVLTAVLFDDTDENDPLEIFKRGNPNPFCEKFALTQLFLREAARIGDSSLLIKTLSAEQVDGLTLELSPVFARHGLRIQKFDCVKVLLSQISRLDPTETCMSDIFRHQVKEILFLITLESK